MSAAASATRDMCMGCGIVYAVHYESCWGCEDALCPMCWDRYGVCDTPSCVRLQHNLITAKTHRIRRVPSPPQVRSGASRRRCTERRWALHHLLVGYRCARSRGRVLPELFLGLGRKRDSLPLETLQVDRCIALALGRPMENAERRE